MTTALERLASLAAALVNAPMAALVRVKPGRVDILAAHQVPALAYAVEMDDAAAGFAPGMPGIACNTFENPYFATHPMVLGTPFLKAVIRVPVPTAGRVALVIGYCEPIQPPKPERIADLVELAKLAAREFEVGQAHTERFDTEFGQSADNGAYTAGLPEASFEKIVKRVDKASHAVALLDRALNYIHVNKAMALLNQRAADAHIGRNIRDVEVPSVEALEAIFQIALRDGRVFEQVELISERSGEHVRVYSFSCQPLRLKGSDDVILEVIASDVTSLRADEARLEDGLQANLADGALAQAFQLDPTVRFLTETLVKRQSLRQRKAASYLTLRSWRKPVRSYQIEALKALKTAPPHSLIDTAASEIVEAVARVVGTSSFAHVTPVPCSRSRDDACLSRMLAAEVARRIGKPLSLLLASAPGKGSSHPKDNLTRPPLKLVEAATGPVLIIDDVATSGAHLEEAITKLRPSAHSVFAVAWIGGDADDSA